MRVCVGVCVTGASDDKRWQIGVKASRCSFTMPTENRGKEASEKKAVKNRQTHSLANAMAKFSQKTCESQRVRWRITEEQFQNDVFFKAFITIFFLRLMLLLFYQRLHGHLRPGKYRSDLNTLYLRLSTKQNHLFFHEPRKKECGRQVF